MLPNPNPTGYVNDFERILTRNEINSLISIIGSIKNNNGILIGIFKGLRKVNIQNGFGIAKVYSNEETKNIIEQIIKAFFKQGKFYEGLKAGIFEDYGRIDGKDVRLLAKTLKYH